MATTSLTHSDAHLYDISLKNLEIVHHKINQVLAQLFLLSDWVTESATCSLSLQQQGMVDGILCSLVFLLETALQSLPEI